MFNQTVSAELAIAKSEDAEKCDSVLYVLIDPLDVQPEASARASIAKSEDAERCNSVLYVLIDPLDVQPEASARAAIAKSEDAEKYPLDVQPEVSARAAIAKSEDAEKCDSVLYVLTDPLDVQPEVSARAVPLQFAISVHSKSINARCWSRMFIQSSNYMSTVKVRDTSLRQKSKSGRP
ncbi:hypothetical protein HNY73_001775 [Argiope bruennichi]|uniref:Uncharacterized protein n=1 Tax=Argiope bruennichi TaxID=94029 RepID=A0A8T0FVZ1_ARGBR|nr:hypothetical protein HNY73_001775 [Argiope bruennichi]